jgi:CRISPR-associated protein Cst2
MRKNMNNDKIPQIKDAKALTLTYLVPVSFASLNGSDKEADNMSNIKKITIGREQFPYVSSQAKRRAIRDQLGTLGEKLSEGVETTIAKGAASTLRRPDEYIDDDLFGYMGTEEATENAKGKSITRTSVIRTTSLLALSKYEGDLDYGTNLMGTKTGGDPNIFETEVHSGVYRGTDLIELDRVGKGEGFKKELDNKEKARRVKILLVAIKNLWLSGRQTRFLADLSPKFIVATMLRTKNPIFLESVLAEGNVINGGLIEETIQDFKNEIICCAIGVRQGMFTFDTTDTTENETDKEEKPIGYISQNCKTIGEVFEEMARWIDDHYT